MPLPQATIEELIEGFYEGKYSVFNLPKTVYIYNATQLDGMFFAGYGQVPTGAIKEIEKAVNFRTNIGRFSGAKTFQQSKDLTDFVFLEDGKKRPFAEFRDKALKINSEYNVNWLKTEQESVFLQSQNARKWMKYEAEAEIFPVLKYVTVGDERVRHDHAALDGLKARVSDPIWNSIMPQNGYGCRCTVIQLEETRPTTKAQQNRQTSLIREEFKKNPDFDYNPGKNDFIFKENGKGKHQYFKVPKEFSEDLKNNFNLPTIEQVTGRGL